MKNIKDIHILDNNSNLHKELLKNYIEASKDTSFVSLVNKIKLTEEEAMKYTSKLQRSVSELKNCKNCKGLSYCKNSSNGYIYYPRKEGKLVQFDAIACKYLQKKFKEEDMRAKFFDEPLLIQNANIEDIDLIDKNRMELIRWVKKFIKDYKNNKHIKGLYLHGSFGSGKSYILSALLNNLASLGANAIIVYYPELLRKLKESFNNDNISYDEIINELKKADLLLLDDIGAETLTSWSRDEVLGTILQYRMDSMLPTFFTSNLNIDELTEHLSETRNNVDLLKAKRIIERIKQLSDDIELVSKNRRN